MTIQNDQKRRPGEDEEEEDEEDEEDEEKEEEEEEYDNAQRPSAQTPDRHLKPPAGCPANGAHSLLPVRH